METLEITRLIARAPWREAVTYRKTWPHGTADFAKHDELVEAVAAALDHEARRAFAQGLLHGYRTTEGALAAAGPGRDAAAGFTALLVAHPEEQARPGGGSGIDRAAPLARCDSPGRLPAPHRSRRDFPGGACDGEGRTASTDLGSSRDAPQHLEPPTMRPLRPGFAAVMLIW